MDNTKTLAEAVEAANRRAANGPWYPACGGSEVPFTCKGYRLLYMWQPSTGRHAYLNLDSDVFLDDVEADRILG